MTKKTEPRIRAEVSLYPLRQAVLHDPIDAAVEVFRSCGLEPIVGTMSTQIQGDRSKLFSALDQAFEAASAKGDLVMTIHVSNACKG
jgi:uncharacterized protein YqgV (UPF0045/DUF77 family)